jgi:hypothetical protein
VEGELKFRNLLKEPPEFESFLNDVVRQDPVLTKVWNFISNPPIDTASYSLKTKVQQLIEITQRDNFEDAVRAVPLMVDEQIKRFSGTAHQECYEHLEYLFTPLFFSILDKLNEDPEHPRCIGEVYQEKAAYYLIEYPEAKYESRSLEVCDFWMPLFREFNTKIRNQHTGECTDELCLEYFAKEPDRDEFHHYWDRYWVSRTKDISTDDEEGREIYRESTKKRFCISLMYRGRKLSFKWGSQFQCQLFERYEPLIKKITTKAFERVKWYYDGGIDDGGLEWEEPEWKSKKLRQSDQRRIIKQQIEWQLKEELWSLAQKYKDKEDHPNPSGYFQGYLRYAGGDEYKSSHISTKEVDIPCDENCRKEKEYTGKWPCEYQTSAGYCKDPRREREARERIERPGPSFDMPMTDNLDEAGENTYFEYESSEIDIEKSLEAIARFLNQKEETLYRLYYQEENTQEDIAKILKTSQSNISKQLKNLESKIEQLIDDNFLFLPRQ